MAKAPGQLIADARTAMAAMIEAVQLADRPADFGESLVGRPAVDSAGDELETNRELDEATAADIYRVTADGARELIDHRERMRDRTYQAAGSVRSAANAFLSIPIGQATTIQQDLERWANFGWSLVYGNAHATQVRILIKGESVNVSVPGFADTRATRDWRDVAAAIDSDLDKWTPHVDPYAATYRVDTENAVVWVNGTPHAVTPEAAALFHHLLARRGGRVSGRETTEAEPRCGSRHGKIREKMPPVLAALIEIDKSGTRLALPAD